MNFSKCTPNSPSTLTSTLVYIEVWMKYKCTMQFLNFGFKKIASVSYYPSQSLQLGTKPLEKIHKTRIFNLNVGKQRVKTVSHTPLPRTMLLLGGMFRSTLNGGGGGLEFYTNNQFARSSSISNNFLNTFVPDCCCFLYQIWCVLLDLFISTLEKLNHFRD